MARERPLGGRGLAYLQLLRRTSACHITKHTADVTRAKSSISPWVAHMLAHGVGSSPFLHHWSQPMRHHSLPPNERNPKQSTHEQASLPQEP